MYLMYRTIGNLISTFSGKKKKVSKLRKNGKKIENVIFVKVVLVAGMRNNMRQLC